MDKPQTRAALRKDREWTNQRHRQYRNKMQNGLTRETGSIETKHIMDKPETQTVLEEDTKWTNQTEAVLRKDTEWTNQ
jgi:hypothetical protein